MHEDIGFNDVQIGDAVDTFGGATGGEEARAYDVYCYVSLARKRVVVAPGKHFFLRVSTDAPTVQWALHGRSGVLRAGTLRIRAPKSPGVYHLYVTVGSHSAACTVVVA